MRICLVSTGDLTRDAAAHSLARSLIASGNQVSAASVAARGGFPADVATVDRPPRSLGGRLRRRLQGTRAREEVRLAALEDLVAGSGAQIIYPARLRDLPVSISAAERGGAVVAGAPGWDVPRDVDLVQHAPANPTLSSSAAGPGLGHHFPGWKPDAESPRPDRHRGTEILLAHRSTDTTPGRYLGSALERAGVTVHRRQVLDWDRIPATVGAVVIVESPYPALEVRGTRPPIPIIFWVHHGEHHVDANLRLLRKYQADAVLLAHSWHLAHRFPVPIHRFPFGIPMELFPDPPTPFPERLWDVAMVGAGTHFGGGRYDLRARMVTELEDAFRERARFPRRRVSPEEMAHIYDQSRIVLNEGGVRHHPITMRVFEAVGAGALLLTDDLPGTEILFDPDHHFRLLAEPFGDRVRQILADPESARVALAARAHGLARHTTDHRVDELMAVIAATRPGPASPPAQPAGLAGLVDRDLDARTILATSDMNLQEEIPELVVWTLQQKRDSLRPGGFDAVALDRVPEELDALLVSAKRYIYGTGTTTLDAVQRSLARTGRPHQVEDHGDVFRVDLMCYEGYRTSPDTAATT